ncbi:glycoside hydrolase family 127 protein [Microbacterium sp. zg.Y625]|uniref:glycoside hydrolase family 127 protein n=1 Tax=Microbacterium jiangjiandongii TaxID=3049071 RepID=UPI00214C654B|nr:MULTISPECIES: beta-L-arabinofuranosidase domain-containing protein [unclassified Microbacterium]MCR2793690.1 glycoside hydrolase family 127 protein [Microbacterium sp. zg.Y625]WIM26037.1 glycoside hydrolase family 127 protein [Microbacterium sp. zg-Y625]
MSDTAVPLAPGIRHEAGPDAGRPMSPSHTRWRPLGLAEVRIDGGFWGERQERNASDMIAHVERWIEKMGWAGNFDAAVQGRLPADRRGREFSDSEIYKLLEAMSWEVGRTGDADLDARLRRLAARVAAAQEDDGYLNTMFGRPGHAARYSDLQWGHELYCFGHLIQAGVARARTHGDDELVRVAIRAADHVCREFGPDGNQGVCGHPEIEVALVELFRVTGQRRYLDQARLFIDRRGRGVLGEIGLGSAYFQDDVPVREATVFDGHAVRALYLAAGAADVADETGEQALLDAVVQQTTATLARRTYLTGGMGAHHEGESFGLDFELPPDRAYSETCAGVASVMLNHRLLLATADARHADAVERALFNVVAASPAANGRAFFYTNPLQQRVPGREVDPDEASPRAASSLRAPWFEVSCCPTNLTRTFASLGAYLASVDDTGLQLHQFAPATIRTELAGGPLELEVRTAYPADGRLEISATGAAGDWTLSVRVPGWVPDGLVRVDGVERRAEDGYLVVSGPRAGDTVVVELPMRARWTWADPRVDAVRGQVAVERGPVVYALESVDLGADVADARVSTQAAPLDDDGRVVVRLRTAATADAPWPYAGAPPAGETDTDTARDVALVPYHAWAERGPSTMRVWMPVDTER